MGLFARGGRLLGKRPGPTVLLCGGFLFFSLVVCLLLLGWLQPRCNSATMPCVINEKGGCLCAARAADGTCWQRMEPALRCYRSTVVVKSGICQGNYETRLCAKSQEEIDLVTESMGTATTELHPNNNGTCNMSYVLENSRCRAPQARQENPGRDFVHADCCRAPIQTCASDTDCCNCGQESQACVARLRCLSTQVGDNGTVVSDSIDCESDEDACLQFSYPGCDGGAADCAFVSESFMRLLTSDLRSPQDIVSDVVQDPDAVRLLADIDPAIEEPLSTAAVELEREREDPAYASRFNFREALRHIQGAMSQTIIPVDPSVVDSSCCWATTREDLRCECRHVCAMNTNFPGCPCLQLKEGCFRRQCVQTSAYFADGGVERHLFSRGARNIKLCYADNCNQ